MRARLSIGIFAFCMQKHTANAVCFMLFDYALVDRNGIYVRTVAAVRHEVELNIRV